MYRKFDKKFADLINYNVPRTFLQNPNDDNSDIPTQQTNHETDELPKLPDDGFVTTYCSKR